MKDFLIAEYKTLILVLLFCGSIFSWFYVRELEKDAEKTKKTEWVYQCLEPGKRVGTYHLGASAPAFDDTWEALTDAVPGMTSWRHQGGDMIINVSADNTIRTIEIYPSDETYETCQADFDNWKKTNQPTASPFKAGALAYYRYAGIHSVSRITDGSITQIGWIVTGVR